MPGWFGRTVAGIAGGLAGGLVFGVLMQLTGVISAVAGLVDQESVAVGWAVHMSIAVFVGLTYTVLFGLFADGLPISTVLATFYGIIWWVLGGLTLMPLRLGLGLFVFDTTAWQSLAGHATYGLVLGVVYTGVCRWLAGRRDRAEPFPAAWSPAPEPITPSPEWPSPPLFPPPAPHSRAGVSPLPPEARALRRRNWFGEPDYRRPPDW